MPLEHFTNRRLGKRTGALLVDTPAEGRSIASQSEIRKMGMKTISLPGKDLVFKSTRWLLIIVYWLFAGGAEANKLSTNK